ncbi:MAG: hypothetical protein SFU25_01640 [Candidatus Caenarcaniphilales bacterium]|nr:hypothetical protein [Candidatus Caenarcaniphilales bacterium]
MKIQFSRWSDLKQEKAIKDLATRIARVSILPKEEQFDRSNQLERRYLIDQVLSITGQGAKADQQLYSWEELFQSFTN